MSAPLTPEVRSQYEALTAGVGLAELTGRTQIELTGNDRATFLNNFCTNDIKRLTPGTGCEAFITSVQGKTIGFVNVFCGEESIVVETTPDQAESLIGHLDRYLITEDVRLTDRSTQWTEILVSGRQAKSVLASACDAAVPAEALSHVNCTIRAAGVSLRRAEITGPNCFLLNCQTSDAATVAAHLTESGATACSSDAVEICRVENGTPIFGRDITDKNLPQEVNRNEHAISFTKGCYLGQETVARLDALGHVNRLLVAVKFAGDEIPSHGVELFAAEKNVGCVTSAVYSPRFDSALALAYIRTSHSEPGAHVNSECGAGEVVQLAH